MQIKKEFNKNFEKVLIGIDKSIADYKYSKFTTVKLDIITLVDKQLGNYILKLEIINGVLIIHKPLDNSAEITHRRRSEAIIKLLENTLFKNKIKDCVLFIHVRDTNLLYDEPFFILAKPITKKGILLIDNSFIDAEPESKTMKEGGVMVSLEDIKNKISVPKNKINTLFFIGQNVPLNKSKIFFRQYFSVKKFPFEVKTKGYMNMAEYSNWKYLLNLPGYYPFSFRFKFLFLMNSFVININLDYAGEGKWITIMDALFEPGVDYIDIIHIMKNRQVDIRGMEKLTHRILNVYNYYNKNPIAYKKIVANGKHKGSLLTMNNIYLVNAYLYNAYAKKIKKNMVSLKDSVLLSRHNDIIYESPRVLIYTINDMPDIIIKVLDYTICKLKCYTEVRVYETIKKHAAFLTLHDCFIHKNGVYYVLDRAEMNLPTYLKKNKNNEIIIMKQVKKTLLKALKVLHKYNIAYGKICKTNILYRNNAFYLADFSNSIINASPELCAMDLEMLSIMT